MNKGKDMTFDEVGHYHDLQGKLVSLQNDRAALPNNNRIRSPKQLQLDAQIKNIKNELTVLKQRYPGPVSLGGGARKNRRTKNRRTKRRSTR